MTRTATIVLAFATLVIACGGDPDPQPDTGAPDSSMDVEDAGRDTAEAPDTAAPDAPLRDLGESSTLCDPCTDNAQCGGMEDLCLTIVEGESFCSQTCETSDDCATGYFCGLLDEATGVQQCVPDNLTCVDRCSAAGCTGTDVCDPFTGQCIRPLRLCETGCVLNTLCGDGPEDLCLNVPNTPDQERACFTGCNPQAETSQCPADFFCASLDAENEPESGVCFPFEGTCVDRCVDANCPVGQNCNPVTGQCSASQFGPCDPGCANNTECGGQDDLCLDLGIGDGPHCWQDCSSNACPGGYDCRSLLGTTIRVCIPLGNDCSACYDNGCYPDGVCNPVDDLCEEIPTLCASAADCQAGELCDPVSSSCVAIGRGCNGSTWAVDCDNAVTKCTSQRATVDGTCEQICAADADCVVGQCVDTNLGKFCLDDLGGAGTCGTLQPPSTTTGRSCNPGGCPGSAPTCVDGGNINGFCSSPCLSDASCGGGQVCGPATGGGQFCLHANCLCAGSSNVGASGEAALESALSQLGLSQCGIAFEARLYEDVPSLTQPAADHDWLTRRVAYPIASTGQAASDATSLDGATDVARAIAKSASLAGIALTPLVRNFVYPGAQGPLAQAIAELIVAGGSTPDLASLDAAVAGIPLAVQLACAPVVSAAAVAVDARAAAAAVHWGASAPPAALFAGAPFAALPASTGQTAVALDPAVATDLSLLDAGSLFARDLVASADFVGQIPDAAVELQGLGAQTFATLSVSTPVGQVVIADSSADTHDIATHGAEIAVLIDLGGDDTYTVPAGANASIDNSVSILLDLGGADAYGYDVVADANDAGLLPSDSDGRIVPGLPINQDNGPVSASDVGRQGSGRLGVGILVDLGPGIDSYDSLRMSQGAAVMGLGVLFDDGPADFRSEALSQGAALGGLAILWIDGSDANTYATWHAGQGFGAFGGAGIAFDRGGDDGWFADPGTPGTVLYLSTADRGVSNRNLAQGAALGVVGQYVGGLGLLRDASGNDSYDIGTFGQGYARGIAFAAVVDGAGADVWNGRGLVQGVGEWRGGGVLWDAAGDDSYNATATKRLVGQGVGQTLAWGSFIDLGGTDTVEYLPSGGGVGIDGGFGLALCSGGADMHTVASDASWGFSQNSTMTGDPGFGAQTIGIFIDTGGDVDTYTRPTLTGVGNDGVWSPLPSPSVYSIGVDN